MSSKHFVRDYFRELDLKNTFKGTTWKDFLLRFFQGLLIGGGGILPGISGGVLCVVFGIYLPLMAFFTTPFKAVKQYLAMYIPVFLGGVSGFVFLAKLVELMLSWSSVYTTWLFIGLIAGTLPALFKEAGKKGFYIDSFISLVVGFIFTFVLLWFAKSDFLPSVEPNFGWMLFSGVLWGLSIVVPGMTSSSILMAIDLYDDLAAAISSLNFALLIPWAIGLLGTIILTARFVKFLFDRFYSAAYHFIVGVVISSTIVIIPRKYGYFIEVIISVAIFVAGMLITYYVDKLTSKKASK